MCNIIFLYLYPSPFFIQITFQILPSLQQLRQDQILHTFFIKDLLIHGSPYDELQEKSVLDIGLEIVSHYWFHIKHLTPDFVISFQALAFFSNYPHDPKPNTSFPLILTAWGGQPRKMMHFVEYSMICSFPDRSHCFENLTRSCLPSSA